MNDKDKDLARASLQHIDNVFDKIKVMVNHELWDELGVTIDTACHDTSCWFEVGGSNFERALLGNGADRGDLYLVIARDRDGVGVRLHFANLVRQLGWDKDPAALEARVMRYMLRWEVSEKQHAATRVRRGNGAIAVATTYCGIEENHAAAYLHAFRGMMCGDNGERHRALWLGYELGVLSVPEGKPQHAQLWPVVEFLQDHGVSVSDVTKLFTHLLWSRLEKSMSELVAIVGALDKLKCDKGQYAADLVGNISNVLTEQFGDHGKDGVVRTDYLGYLGSHGLWGVTAEKRKVVRDAFVGLIANGGYPAAQQYMTIFERELAGGVDRDELLELYTQQAFKLAMQTKRWGVAHTIVQSVPMTPGSYTEQEKALAHTMTFGLRQPIGFTWVYVAPPKGWRPNK